MSNKLKIGVLLSGCGVYDGSEIHEAVLTLLAIEQQGAQAVCIALDVKQHHVVNHLNGKEMNEERNVLIESARIARGEIQSLDNFDSNSIDALAIPGGFGAAKNLSKWAFAGHKGEINPQVKDLIVKCFDAKKPIAAMCMGPTVVAKALAEKGASEKLTVGSVNSSSPYDISDISNGMNALGADAQMAEAYEAVVDTKNLIVSSPCYMMDATILMVNEGIQQAIKKLVGLVELAKTT
ncbi:isoprenoid biosynthesis glyoxalase ElbB [bacterium]|nr:isoprenoid biosynthesis glyoxalase ElbB [bacterium]